MFLAFGFTTWIPFLVDLHPSSRIYDWVYWCHAHDHSWPPFPSESWGCSAWLMPSRWISYYGASPPPWRSRECPRVGGLWSSASAPGLSGSAWIISNQILCAFLFFKQHLLPQPPDVGRWRVSQEMGMSTKQTWDFKTIHEAENSGFDQPVYGDVRTAHWGFTQQICEFT